MVGEEKRWKEMGGYSRVGYSGGKGMVGEGRAGNGGPRRG